MNKICAFLSFILISTSSNSAINALSAHSRANCVNNETISWDAMHPHELFTTSDHIDTATGTLIHSITTGWGISKRSAAVHWGEGRGGWTVHGYHWIMGSDRRPYLFQQEIVKNCDIYDGWWEMK